MNKGYWKRFLAAVCAGAVVLTSFSGYAARADESAAEEAVTDAGDKDSKDIGEKTSENAKDTGEKAETEESTDKSGIQQTEPERGTDSDEKEKEIKTGNESQNLDLEKEDDSAEKSATDAEEKQDTKDTEEQTQDSEKKEESSETEKVVAGVPVDDQGLPTRGLLISLVEDEKDDTVTAPELFVKLNPCGKKEHNSQPSNYMSSALGCAEFIFERGEGETTWHIVDQTGKKENGSESIGVKSNSYIKRSVESYSDTNDLWHSFLIRPASDVERVYAFIPLKADESSHTFTDASDQYCFSYEAALADEQNWEMTDGHKISGGYIVKGEGEKEHPGKPMEFRTIHLRKKTGGREIRPDYQTNYASKSSFKSLPDTGLQIHIDSLPKDGLQDSVKLHLSCPDTFQNGEGGFGFSSLSAYRKAEMQKWMYKITGKSGMRVVVQSVRKVKGDVYYINVTKKAEVTNDGVNVDLAELGLKKDDWIIVQPYTLDWEKMADTTVFSEKYVKPIRFFNFQYGISCDTGTISVQGQEDTPVQSVDSQHAIGTEPVCDSGKYLQKISLSVEAADEDTDQCGWQDQVNLPNYGLILRNDDKRWKTSKPRVVVIPEKRSGEDCVWYTAEWYRKGKRKYIRTSVVLARVSKAAELLWPDSGVDNADICVIRRIRYIDPDQKTSENHFFQGELNKKYEVTNSDKKVRYPQSGKDTWQVYPADSRGAGKDGNLALCGCDVWNSADPEKWKNEPDERKEADEESVLRGLTFQTDLSKSDERVKSIMPRRAEKKISLIGDADPGNGLPAHSLVILNRTKGNVKGTGVEYKVNLEMPAGILGFSVDKETSSEGEVTTSYGRNAGLQTADSHLYRQKEDGTWEKIEQNDDADWVNSGTLKFNQIRLSDTYAYGVHAHLKDNEAIVITPRIDFYDINYSVDMFSHDDYDVLADECKLPDDCAHLTRDYFQGRFTREKRSSKAETTILTVTTVPKDEDSGDEEQASVLPAESVRPLKVNLFDYDFGNEHEFLLGDQTQGFKFRYDPKNVQDADVNMWHRGPFSGILKNRLAEDGSPVFRYSTPFDEKKTGLFDLNEVPEKINGGTKKVYPNVDFDFIYDKENESYSYDSAINAACFDKAKNHVYEYDHTLGIDGWDAKGAGFFPFNNFSQEGVWGTKDKKNKGTYLIDQKTDIDYHFGLSTTQTFQIPEDGKVNNKDLQFHFSGDDDAWVFVDGQLVLDMGGIHEAVQGGINFTNGTWYISADQNSPWDTFGSDSYTSPIVTSGNLSDKIADFPSGSGKIGTDTGTWAKGTSHTFSVFYLERGGTLSDLSMNFNLPSVKNVPEEPKEEFVFTGKKGTYQTQALGMALLLSGAAIWIRKRRGNKNT